MQFGEAKEYIRFLVGEFATGTNFLFEDTDIAKAINEAVLRTIQELPPELVYTEIKNATFSPAVAQDTLGDLTWRIFDLSSTDILEILSIRDNGNFAPFTIVKDYNKAQFLGATASTYAPIGFLYENKLYWRPITIQSLDILYIKRPDEYVVGSNDDDEMPLPALWHYPICLKAVTILLDRVEKEPERVLARDYSKLFDELLNAILHLIKNSMLGKIKTTTPAEKQDGGEKE